MAVTGGNGSGLAGQVAQRWRLIDPLLQTLEVFRTYLTGVGC